MRKFYMLLSGALMSVNLFAQNSVELSSTDNWGGYMNVFELPTNGGAYIFGQGWGVSDLQTTLNTVDNYVILQPNFNTYQNAINSGDPNEISFWTDGANAGNKDMEATTLVEPGATFNEQDLTFFGTVISNDLDSGYQASFFIKALDPNNGFSDALGGSGVSPIPASGNFSVSIPAADLPAGLIIQYGFTIRGINANPAEEENLGSIVLGPIECSVNVNTTLTNQTIEANAAGLNYQWLNCDDNFSLIPGATAQSYTAETNGNYAVIVTDGGCSDTSACVEINTVGLIEQDLVFTIYPNPVSSELYLETNSAYDSFKIINATGQIVKTGSTSNKINVDSIPNGIYFIQLKTSNSVISRKFIKK